MDPHRSSVTIASWRRRVRSPPLIGHLEETGNQHLSDSRQIALLLNKLEKRHACQSCRLLQYQALVGIRLDSSPG